MENPIKKDALGVPLFKYPTIVEEVFFSGTGLWNWGYGWEACTDLPPELRLAVPGH